MSTTTHPETAVETTPQPQPRIIEENRYERVIELRLTAYNAIIAGFNEYGSVTIKEMALPTFDELGHLIPNATSTISLNADETQLLINGYQAWMAKCSEARRQERDEPPF